MENKIDKKRENRIKCEESYIRGDFYGESSGSNIGVTGMDYTCKDFYRLTDREVMEAQGRLLLNLASDISAIYQKLGIGFMDRNKEITRINTEIRRLAIEQIELADKEKAERKIKRELKLKSRR